MNFGSLAARTYFCYCHNLKISRDNDATVAAFAAESTCHTRTTAAAAARKTSRASGDDR